MSREERKAMIARGARPGLSLSRQCRLLSLSRSSFYYAPQGESAANLALMRRIDELYLQHPFYGSRQMSRHLRLEGIVAGRHRVRRLMRLMGLEAIYQAPKTSEPHPAHRVYPYLLRGVTIERANHVWCADITYIPVRRGFLYLVAIMDWATRHVLAWRLSNTLDAGFCVAALKAALSRHGRPKIFNTDQGSQFTSLDFTGTLSDAEVAISMDGRGRSHGQHLHRTPVAVAEIRGRLSQRVGGRLRGRTRHRRLDRLLQRQAAAFGARREDARAGLPRRQARGNDGQGLRLAHIPTGPAAAKRDCYETEFGSVIRNRSTP